jgi:predicted nucleic acid-binding protein
MKIALDTNIIVYVYDRRQSTKSDTCNEISKLWLNRTDNNLALQVLAELTHVLRRRVRMNGDDIATILGVYSRLPQLYAYTHEDVLSANQMATEGLFSTWDALLISASERAGVTHLISEDMQDGFRYKTLEIVTPFAADKSPNPRIMELLAA